MLLIDHVRFTLLASLFYLFFFNTDQAHVSKHERRSTKLLSSFSTFPIFCDLFKTNTVIASGQAVECLIDMPLIALTVSVECSKTFSDENRKTSVFRNSFNIHKISKQFHVVYFILK